MIQTPKPKRKHPFVIIETGETVYLDRIQNATTYFVCDSQNLSLDDNYFPIEKSKLKEVNKTRSAISAKPKSLTESEKSFKKELNVFFASQMLEIPETCENCGAKLNAFTSFAKRSVTAHILEKNKNAFPMVATHPMNRLFLGCGLFSDCNCHSCWDLSDAETRKQMKCYTIALKRLEAFKSLIPANKQAKAEKYLGL